MRELDAVLERFVDVGYNGLDPDERERFARILEWPDPELAAYLLGRARPEDTEDAALIDRIKHAYRP